MIFDLNNTIRAGNPARVFDANGLEWTKCLECDTETGRILRHCTDKDGNIVLTEDRREVKTEEVFAAAPLLVVPVHTKGWEHE